MKFGYHKARASPSGKAPELSCLAKSGTDIKHKRNQRGPSGRPSPNRVRAPRLMTALAKFQTAGTLSKRVRCAYLPYVQSNSKPT